MNIGIGTDATQFLFQYSGDNTTRTNSFPSTLDVCFMQLSFRNIRRCCGRRNVYSVYGQNSYRTTCLLKNQRQYLGTHWSGTHRHVIMLGMAKKLCLGSRVYIQGNTLTHGWMNNTSNWSYIISSLDVLSRRRDKLFSRVSLKNVNLDNLKEFFRFSSLM